MRFPFLVFILFTCLAASPAMAQDLKKGLKAYKAGDYETALKEWRPLAENGNPGAQYNLGFNYLQGKGVPKDLVQAYFWFDLAARKGRGIAQQLRDGIANKMTAEQIADAKSRARKWLAEHER